MIYIQCVRKPYKRSFFFFGYPNINFMEGIMSTVMQVGFFKEGYAKRLILFLLEKYKGTFSILQVGTGDSPMTIPFYEKCGFVRSHSMPNFFIDNYNHPIYECGIQLIDMIYLQRKL